MGTPQIADRVIREEKTNLVFLGHPALANPHWPVWAAQELGHNDPFSPLPQDWSWWLKNRPGSENSGSGTRTDGRRRLGRPRTTRGDRQASSVGGVFLPLRQRT